ncbi:CBS domain-containing protein [Mitsuaria sp. WAJ17]|uniref:CBS domain-containing protein n=1 Tax=Mitsuaria sp. WAJ17 TaxID=2761452 RepID=UPI0016030330|nr:CBS domain-containing protein [Mitsuaria sp. WAJ17]MBB2488008.1 CBS domain-containing protein [Mitsuaria sp. WAJ17]
MTQAAEIMTPDPITITPRETLQQAAQLMDEFNVGALPVCENGQLLGVITDRDIAVRAVAVGQDPTVTRVSEVMSAKAHACTAEADVGEVLTQMARVQIRRLMVLDQAQRLVGVISLGDFAVWDTAGLEATLRSISLPGRPERMPAITHGAPPALQPLPPACRPSAAAHSRSEDLTLP